MSFDGSVVEAAAEPISEVDATGAGDAFDGVLLAALARGSGPEAALRRACHAGALVAASADTWPAGARRDARLFTRRRRGASALAEGDGVVALETSVIGQGLPVTREPRVHRADERRDPRGRRGAGVDRRGRR